MLEMPRYALLKTQRPSRRGQWRRVGRKHAGFRKQRDDDDDDDVRHSSSRHCDTPRERREASRKTGSSAHPRPWFLPLGSPTHHLLLHQTPRPPSHQTPLQSRGGVCGRAVAAAYKREMLLMAAPAADEHQKRRRGRPLCADLLLNCDLPPPAKFFGPFPALQRAGGTDEKGDGGKDVLLRALRLSQSRAREAEEKLAAAAASSGGLAALLVRDSVALSAHRRWVMMLEAENSALRAGGGGAAGAEPEEEEDGAGAARHRMAAAWWVALAVCVGLALGNLLL